MTNRPKGKLFALLAIFVAIGLVTATGAFTTVTAQRTVTVDTAGDSAALLGLQGNTSSGNDRYITTGGTPAEITIDFSSSSLGADASGINVNATTNVSHMINVSNNGPNNINFYVTIDSQPAGVSMFFYNGGNTADNVTGSANSFVINSGTQASIGVSINLDSSVSSFTTSVTFHAESQ